MKIYFLNININTNIACIVNTESKCIPSLPILYKIFTFCF